MFFPIDIRIYRKNKLYHIRYDYLFETGYILFFIEMCRNCLILDDMKESLITLLDKRASALK